MSKIHWDCLKKALEIPILVIVMLLSMSTFIGVFILLFGIERGGPIGLIALVLVAFGIVICSDYKDCVQNCKTDKKKGKR